MTRRRGAAVAALVVALLAAAPPASSQGVPSWPAGRWLASGEFGRDDDATMSALHTEGFFDFRVIVAEDGTVLSGGSLSLQGARVEEEPVDHAAVILSFRGDQLIPGGDARSVKATGSMRIAGEVLAEVTGSGLIPVPVDVTDDVTVALIPTDATCASVTGTLIADFARQTGAPVGVVASFYAVPETVGQELYDQIIELDADIYEAMANGVPVDVGDIQRLVLLVEQLNASIARGANCGLDLGNAAPGGPTHLWLEKILFDALRNIHMFEGQVSTPGLVAALQAGIRGGALTTTATDPAAAAGLFDDFDHVLAGRAELAAADGDLATIGLLQSTAEQYHLPQTLAALG